VAREANGSRTADESFKPMLRYNLAICLQVLFEATGDVEALREAIEIGRESVEALSADHAARALPQANLGSSLRMLFEESGDPTARTEARHHYLEAAENTAARVVIRVWSYQQYCALADDEDALAAAEAAIALLPQLAPRALTRGDREHRLASSPSLAGSTASAALSAGRADRAVELLEQARGVLVADIVDARGSDLTRLREAAPNLATAFEDLRTRLEFLDGPSGETAQARRTAQADWDDLITRIRTVDGFGGFLTAPTLDRLAAQAHDGPIVFTTTSTLRCDALILTGDPATPVVVVPLPDLTEAEATSRTEHLTVAQENASDPDLDPPTRRAAQAEVLAILAWLWDTITEPVLTALGHTTTPPAGQPWPRVWWCPVGTLSHLPLHAAGYHKDLKTSAGTPRTVLDRVISSYTATARALGYARTHPHRPANSTLIISVPDAPGTPPLPGAAAEAAGLTDLIPGAHRLPHPTRDGVLKALPEHTVVHFACHGYADVADPAASRLILHDMPLTLADISALRLNGAMAFLSACDTASTTPWLADEAIHITSAFQLAGFPHVIGTLWSVDDFAAQQIAIGVYSRLTRDGTTPPETSRCAEALHQTVRDLRARYLAAPTLWAAHTHTGI